MKQKEVFKKIGGIIQELNDQYEYLKTVTGDLNDLELELFVSNAHFLTDHIEILCKLNLQNSKPKPRIVEKPEIPYQQKFFEPVVQQMNRGAEAKEVKPPRMPFRPIEVEVTNPAPEPEEKPSVTEEDRPVPQFDFSSQAPEDTYSYQREEPETIRHELILDESENWDDDEVIPVADEEIEIAEEVEDEIKEEVIVVEEPVKPVADLLVITETPVAEKPAEPEVEKVADKPAAEEQEVITRNQKISSQLADKSTSKTDQLSIKPIADIKVAITLNDKMLYVKDLFNGYNLAYSEAIEILNRFNTFEEAMRFLKTNYITKNNWDSKPATTEKFYALLRRRYV